jgi:pyridoxine/pyridoxamine 5'-phosphate oxidase
MADKIMKIFKAKSSVKRALVKEFGTEVFEAGLVVQNKDKLWYFEPGFDEPKKVRVYANSSKVENPCSLVWTIAEEMGLEAKRKDVLAACEEAGVTFYTARTQYQKYKEALRGDVK